MAAAQDRSPRSFAEVALELGLCDERKIRDALLVKQKLAEMDVHRSLEDILIERGYISKEGIEQVQRALKGDNRLAGFELVERVGSGAMGAVFRARQVSLDRIVAVKVLPRHLAEDPSFVKRFLREARNVAKLNHPNIIQGIDVGEDRGYYYFAMEYIDGPNARDLIEEKGPMEEREALRIVLGAARGLEHAWRNSILHRDIKPANIMLTSDNVVKLCDLGLATARGPEADASGSSVGKAVGTPYYISPEQAMGEKDVDTRTDIYSLGASLYHMLSGHPPFEGNSAPVVLAMHLKERVQPLNTIRNDVSRNTTLFLAKTLAKDRGNRHQTPVEVIEDLEDLLANKPPRHSVRFRQDSTYPLPFLSPRQTGRHGTVAIRRIKAKKAQSSGVMAMILLLLLLIILAGFIFWQFSSHGASLPGFTRPPPPPGGRMTPDTTPIVITPASATPTERPRERPDVQSSEEKHAETVAAVAEIARDLETGNIGPEEAKIRLSIFEEIDLPANIEKRIADIVAESDRRIAVQRAALEQEISEAVSLVSQGRLSNGLDTFQLLYKRGITTEDLAPLERALTTAYQERLLELDSTVHEALIKNDTAQADKLVNAWERDNTVALDRFDQLQSSLTKIRNGIRKVRQAATERNKEGLLLLAALIQEAPKSLKAGRSLHKDSFPPEMPSKYGEALERESEKLLGFVDGIARKVGKMDRVSVPYRNMTVSGKPTYTGEGKIKVRTLAGMELVLSLFDVSHEQVLAWGDIALKPPSTDVARYLVFTGETDVLESLGYMPDRAKAPDLALLLNALKTHSQTRKIQELKAEMSSVGTGGSAYRKLAEILPRIQALRAAGVTSQELDDLEKTARGSILKHADGLLAAKGQASPLGLKFVYDSAGAQELADWMGIDGGWIWQAPGLAAQGGRLTHLFHWGQPLHVNVLLETGPGQESLVVEAGRTKIVMDPQHVQVLAGEKVLAEGAKPGLSRFPLDIVIADGKGKLKADKLTLKWELPAGETAAAGPVYLEGKDVSLWGMTLEGTPIAGPGISALEMLAEARKHLEQGEKAHWPILPGLPGWLVSEGTWNIDASGYLEGAKTGTATIGLALKTATNTACEVTYKQHSARRRPRNGSILVVDAVTKRVTTAGARGGSSWIIWASQDQTPSSRDEIEDEVDHRMRVEAYTDGTIRLVANGEQRAVASGLIFSANEIGFGLQKTGAPCGFKDVVLEKVEDWERPDD
ncbi:MAG: serine/threonine protein kinase [Planctomycetes bacterium]|nr:serine/threonine protein kinase [Planctomycetota bacterium]